MKGEQEPQLTPQVLPSLLLSREAGQDPAFVMLDPAMSQQRYQIKGFPASSRACPSGSSVQPRGTQQVCPSPLPGSCPRTKQTTDIPVTRGN